MYACEKVADMIERDDHLRKSRSSRSAKRFTEDNQPINIHDLPALKLEDLYKRLTINFGKMGYNPFNN